MKNPIARQESTHCGYVALVGRPNVGKSTLINQILGAKISITSRKAQTTRNKTLGIKTTDNYQTIYVDTPGIHRQGKSRLNSHMNSMALDTITDVDIIGFVVAGTKWTDEDTWILSKIKRTKLPIMLLINKTDLVAQKHLLLGHIDEIKSKHDFTKIIPLSAKTGTNITALESSIQSLLPSGPFLFPKEQRRDRDDRFWIAEIIREKLTRYLGDELPYAISVMVDRLENRQKITSIAATIYVERPGQRKIIIGQHGENLKKIGTIAREELEKHLAKKVFLQLWIKVKKNWTGDASSLKLFGYTT